MFKMRLVFYKTFFKYTLLKDILCKENHPTEHAKHLRNYRRNGYAAIYLRVNDVVKSFSHYKVPCNTLN